MLIAKNSKNIPAPDYTILTTKGKIDTAITITSLVWKIETNASGAAKMPEVKDIALKNTKLNTYDTSIGTKPENTALNVLIINAKWSVALMMPEMSIISRHYPTIACGPN